jgi:folate-binding protein YgfZ
MSQSSACHALHESAGGVFADAGGWRLPVCYAEGWQAEYQRVQTRAALFDLSHRTRLQLSGRDRATFLHGFCTNDIVKLPNGAGCEAFVINLQARILGYIVVFAGVDALWLDADPGIAEKLVFHFRRYAITEDVEFHDQAQAFSQLRLAGPGAAEVLHALASTRLLDMPAWNMQPARIGHVDCQVRRVGALKLPAFDLLCPASHACCLAETLLSALGGNHAWAGLQAHDVLRIEAGWPEYGRDIDESNLPQEVNRTAQAISWTKGCYLGQEPVCRIRDLGHINRMLVGLKLASPSAAARGTRLRHDGREAGVITSSAFSPRLGRGIALAYVRREYLPPATRLLVADAASTGPVEAEITTLPFGE